MMQPNFNTIDPNQANIPDTAVIQKVLSDEQRLPADQHDKAVRAFFVSDGIASGIGKDLAFVDQIPQFIREIIDNKLWECLYVAKGVVTPYYCRYIKSTDSENFRAFITAKRPNGLETSVETLDRVLQADPEVQRKFRAIIYESRQGQRTDLVEETSYSDYKKLDNSIGEIQQARIRAANRAAEAIPVIGELLDRGLIAIDVAAQLGRDIKDPENLTAEEREYVDKRDLVGLRLDQYIYTNPIPDDEDKEPAYSRELNKYVKDLLGIKDRSKSVRMDNPKKAAEKLLQFYQGDTLKDLIDYLRQGLEPSREPKATVREQSNRNNHSANNNNQLTTDLGADAEATSQAEPSTDSSAFLPSIEMGRSGSPDTTRTTAKRGDKPQQVSASSASSLSPKVNLPALKPAEDVTRENVVEKSEGSQKTTQNWSDVEVSNFEQVHARGTLLDGNSKSTDWELTPDELAERLKLKRRSLLNVFYEKPAEFLEWTKKRDPDGIGWQRSDKKEGRSWLFIPVQESKQG